MTLLPTEPLRAAELAVVLALRDQPVPDLRAACPDGPRYKALGNSMAVNVMTWIGERIALIDAVKDAK